MHDLRPGRDVRCTDVRDQRAGQRAAALLPASRIRGDPMGDHEGLVPPRQLLARGSGVLGGLGGGHGTPPVQREGREP
eukprot:scaffold23982_cov64-Phaeocystis_antarctica.AAC.1